MPDFYTGISRTKLHDRAAWQARACCYSQAALSSNDSKTLYIIYVEIAYLPWPLQLLAVEASSSSRLEMESAPIPFAAAGSDGSGGRLLATDV